MDEAAHEAARKRLTDRAFDHGQDRLVKIDDVMRWVVDWIPGPARELWRMSFLEKFESMAVDPSITLSLMDIETIRQGGCVVKNGIHIYYD